jgi:hypothetical protein
MRRGGYKHPIVPGGEQLRERLPDISAGLETAFSNLSAHYSLENADMLMGQLETARVMVQHIRRWLVEELSRA